MNFFLSILLCIAMAFGGTGELPAEPEAATERTLRNLRFAIDGEALELAPRLPWAQRAWSHASAWSAAAEGRIQGT